MELIVIVGTIVVGFIVLGFFIKQWVSVQKPDTLVSELLKSFDTRSYEQRQEITALSHGLNERLDNAARMFATVQKHIGEFSEIGRSMQNLQDLLKSPKLRGNIGEEVLSDLIGQMFPKGNFFLQHSFRSGVRVDAAIKTDAGLLAIDAKFPLENYQRMYASATEAERLSAQKEFARDLKRHIDAISDKYILPDEGTLDFALMYIPSEAVFYELVQMTEIMTYAKRARVYPVSPTTLYAHLQTILLSFAGKQFETKTKSLFKLLRTMVGDFEKLEGNISVLGKHLGNAYNQMGNVNHGVSQLGQKLHLTEQLETEEQQTLPI